MKWIELHYENQTRHVNVEHIAAFEAARDGDGGSFMRTTGGQFFVSETPDEIMALIRGEA